MAIDAAAAKRNGADAGEAGGTLIFLHIPKTGGTTLQWALKRQYGREGTFCVRGDLDGVAAELDALEPEERRRIRVIHGHMGIGLHQRLPGPARYFTMLRHPVDRVISHYYYVRRRPHHHLHEPIAAGMSLQEYVETGAGGLSKELDNGQTRVLAGEVPRAAPLGGCTRDMLETARHNLDTLFGGVGISERFDESLLTFRRAFDWNLPFYVTRNVTKARPAVEEVDDATVRVIRRHNELDLELYEHGVRQLEDRIREAGPLFPVQLRSFRGLNRAYNGARSVRQRLASAGRATV